MSLPTANLLAGTDVAHPDGQYTTVAKWFHWITLGLMLVALPTGFVIKYIKADPFATKLVFYAIHESAGGMSRPLLKSVFGVPVIETMRHVGFGQARVAGRTSAGRRGGRRATVGVGFSP